MTAILITGKGTSGSWQCRGVQLGAAMRATVEPAAGLTEMRFHDVVMVVKRITPSMLQALRASGTPWAWDCVDSYPQPECTTWGPDRCREWLRAELARLQPTAVIWPNDRMRVDAAWSGPQLVLYHHHRPGIAVNPIREHVRVIGYEGRADYLDGWHEAIRAACAELGASFAVNPPQLADLDVVLALRGPKWNGYAQQHWKSNIKLANAHASGTPFIGMPECGYEETRTGAEYWVKEPADLVRALRWLASQSAREEVSARFLEAAYPVERAAATLREFIRRGSVSV